MVIAGVTFLRKFRMIKSISKSFICIFWSHLAVLPFGLGKYDLCFWGIDQGPWAFESLYENFLSPLSKPGTEQGYQCLLDEAAQEFL